MRVVSSAVALEVVSKTNRFWILHYNVQVAMELFFVSTLMLTPYHICGKKMRHDEDASICVHLRRIYVCVFTRAYVYQYGGMRAHICVYVGVNLRVRIYSICICIRTRACTCACVHVPPPKI